MRKFLFVLASSATIGMASIAVGQAMPVTGGALRDAVDSTDLIEKTAIYVVEGRRYCFSFDGWHGPGWYRCGFAWRRGFGWGGVYGWMGWEYGPAHRRFGHSRYHHNRDVRIREGRHDRMDRSDRDRNRDVRIRDGRHDRMDRSDRDVRREGTHMRDRSLVRGEGAAREGVRGETSGRSQQDGGGSRDGMNGGRSMSGGAPGGEVGRSPGGGGERSGGGERGGGGGERGGGGGGGRDR